MYGAVVNDTCFRLFNRDNQWKQYNHNDARKPSVFAIGSRNPVLFHQFQSGKYSSALIGKLTWTPTWLSTCPSCTWYA